MGQQISVEDAFPVFQKRCTELFEETLLLRSQITVLERQLGEARTEVEQLRAQPPAGQMPQPLSCVDQDALA